MQKQITIVKTVLVFCLVVLIAYISSRNLPDFGGIEVLSYPTTVSIPVTVKPIFTGEAVAYVRSFGVVDSCERSECFISLWVGSLRISEYTNYDSEVEELQLLIRDAATKYDGVVLQLSTHSDDGLDVGVISYPVSMTTEDGGGALL